MPASAIASARAYSWLGPPRPWPRMVTVNSPPERIDGAPPLRAQFVREPGVHARRHRARLALDTVAERDALIAGGADGAACAARKRIGRPRGQREAAARRRLGSPGFGDLIGADRRARASHWPQRRAAYLATIARASASVVGSGTVGPEPMAEGSSPGTSEMAMVTSRAGYAWRASRPPLMRERCLRTRIDLADDGARAQQRARDGLFVLKRYAGRRRDPVGRGAARHQHQDEIVGARRYRPGRARGRRLSGRRRRVSDGRPRSFRPRASAVHSRGAPPPRR